MSLLTGLRLERKVTLYMAANAPTSAPIATAAPAPDAIMLIVARYAGEQYRATPLIALYRPTKEAPVPRLKWPFLS